MPSTADSEAESPLPGGGWRRRRREEKAFPGNSPLRMPVYALSFSLTRVRQIPPGGSLEHAYASHLCYDKECTHLHFAMRVRMAFLFNMHKFWQKTFTKRQKNFSGFKMTRSECQWLYLK